MTTDLCRGCVDEDMFRHTCGREHELPPKSWVAETISEHIGTIATLLAIPQMMINSGATYSTDAIEADIEQARRDLWKKMNDQGIIIAESRTHKAELLADGLAYVTRRELND